MTEDQIERAVERKFDALDKRFMSSVMTQEQYDALSTDINTWAENEYCRVTKEST